MAQREHARGLPDELLLQIFLPFQLPTPAVLGREQHEHLQAQPRRDSRNQINAHQRITDEYAARHKLDLQTLSSITRCCKRFRRIASPVMYHVFPGYKIANPTQFIPTLLKHTDLAASVKQLVLDEWVPRENKHLMSPKDGYFHWLNCISKFGLGRNLVRYLETQPMKAIEDVQVALLLFLCTQVTSLDLTASLSWEEGFMARLCEELVKERPNTLFRGEQDTHGSFGNLPLRQLRELSLRFGQNDDTATVSQFQTLLRLPTIQSLTIYRFTAHDVDFLTRMPQLRELCLWRCSFAESWIREALKSLPNLVSLNVVWAGYNMQASHASGLLMEIDYHELSIAICKYTPKLERLVLDPRELQKLGVVIYPDPPHKDWVDFSGHLSLKYISVEARALWRGYIGTDSWKKDEAAECSQPSYVMPRLVNILPTSLATLVVLANKGHSPCFRGVDLVVLDCLSLVAQASTCLQVLHIDTDVNQFGGTQQLAFHSEEDAECLRKLGWDRRVVVNDAEVARKSPVLAGGTTLTQRNQYDELIHALGDNWNPEVGKFSTKIVRVRDATIGSEELQRWKEGLERRIAARYYQ